MQKALNTAVGEIKPGDEIWLVHEEGASKSRTRARIYSVSLKQIKIQREGCQICSITFARNVPDSYPMFERTSRGLAPKYRIEQRI